MGRSPTMSSSNSLSTRESLARVLEERQNPRSAGMIRLVRAGAYDDYLSDSPSPIMDLVRDLSQNGEHDLVGRAIGGEFDGTKDEADAWAHSPEGEKVFREFWGPGHVR